METELRDRDALKCQPNNPSLTASTPLVSSNTTSAPRCPRIVAHFPTLSPAGVRQTFEVRIEKAPGPQDRAVSPYEKCSPQPVWLVEDETVVERWSLNGAALRLCQPQSLHTDTFSNRIRSSLDLQVVSALTSARGGPF